jgi:hypothetical protein
MFKVLNENIVDSVITMTIWLIGMQAERMTADFAEWDLLREVRGCLAAMETKVRPSHHKTPLVAVSLRQVNLADVPTTLFFPEISL